MRCTRRKSPRAGSAALKAGLCLLLALLAAAAALAQAGNELSAYTSAVARAQPSERLIELERFAVHAQPGPLKIDALEIVVWEYLRAHDTVHALVWARDLADSDSDNAVALALLSNEGRGAMEQGRMKAERLLRMASHGLDNLPQLRRPLGMSESDFTLLRRQTNAMLSGAAGAAELRSKDYIAARDYLHNAVAVEPDNARWDYELALADLNGSDPNRKEGYWYLARAVNLSRGTPQAVEIARYARARYVKDGGSTGDWDQFLVAAAPAPSSGTRPPSSAVASNLPSLPHPPAETPPPVKTAAIKTAPPVKTASIRTPAISQPKQPAPSIWADTSNPPVVQKRRVPSTTGPMSLGILVETSLAHRANRSAVVNSLIDMLRHMDQRDEAFILSYDNNLVFQQDLTTDPQQLEQAMESIRPQKGAVLDDAIAFAAGHLARIAKYPNRVLLVISDGRNVDSHASPLQTSAEINAAGVRIYCIGVEVSDLEGRYRLQALAAGTGGQSNFISDTGQFRKATEQMAQNMGIDFRF